VKRASTARKNSQLTAVVTGVVVIATLYLAKVVFIPLTLALLLSFLLTPVVTLIEQIKLPRGVAILIVIGALVGVLGILGWKTSQQFVDLTNQIPAYKTALIDKIQSVKGEKGQSLAKASATFRDLENEISKTSSNTLPETKGKPSPSSAAANSPSHPMAVEVVPPANPLDSLESMLGPVATAGIILVFTIFMLLDREDLRDRFMRVAGGGRLTAMTQALDEASRRINRYLLLQMMVNIGYGAIIGTGLYFIGIPNASLWAVAAGLLRFLPYAGPPMAAAMPILLSLAIFSGFRHALETAGLFFVLEVIVSNFLEPLLYGAHVGLSALAILVSAIFWTLIWGIPGLLLSTPLTVFLVVMGHYVPSLAFFNVLLGDEPVLAPHAQFYQRLLAQEPTEARHVLDEFLKTDKSAEELYSTVVIPALSLAEQDRYRDELDDDAQALIYQNVREMIEDLDEAPAEESAQEASDATASVGVAESGEGRSDVFCVPARDEADDVVALIVAQLLESRSYKAQSLPIGPVSEMLKQVADAKPQIVCISALPPFGVSHARSLYRRLRPLAPNMRIVICLWHLEGDLNKIAGRLRMMRGDLVFSTVPEVLGYVESELRTNVQEAIS
jgi:predicted PurR-regulated permease PerM